MASLYRVACTAAGDGSDPDATRVTAVSERWPARLWIVRHGQSAGNVARAAAIARGDQRIALTTRDVDVPLSPLGEQQARALGESFRRMGIVDRPEVLLASPYQRARQTAHLFRDAGGVEQDEPIRIDERLREKEFGILDGLTVAGVQSRYPEQAEFRRLLGKFYHRPPGGESWCDIVFRLRAVMDTIALHHSGRRVMIVAHQVVVLCLRYVIERLDEDEILAIDRAGDVANCSITEYRHAPAPGTGGGLALVRYNAVGHLEQDRVATVTTGPDRLPLAGDRVAG